jgi:hypothetical protein
MKKTSDRDLIYTLQNYFATNYECRINVATDTLLFMAADRIKELRKQVNDLRKENNDLRKENSAGLAAELEEAEKRIAELEGVIYRNCDSAQATDSDAKIIDELQLFFNVEVE